MSKKPAIKRSVITPKGQATKVIDSKKSRNAKTWAAKPGGTQKNLWEIFIIALVAFVLYSPVLKASILNWDDPDYVNEEFFKQSLLNLKHLIVTPIQGNYHPLTMLSLLLNYGVSGMNGWSYHLLNVLLHVANSILVFRFVLLLTKGKRVIAFVSAVLFAIHPMHVESVAWISERKDVLYALFFMLGLISYTKYVDTGNRKLYAGTLGFFVLSLLSKPAAVIFPLVLFCVDIFTRRKFTRTLIVEKIPFFVLSLAMGIITYLAQKEGAVDTQGTFDTVTRALMGFYGIMMYFVKLILPFNLSPFYPFAGANGPLPTAYYVAPLFSLLLAAACIYSWRRRRIVAFGILFYIINLLLVLQFLPVGSAIIADRYTYVPYVGLFFIIGCIINDLSKGKIYKAYAITLPAVLLFSFLTFRQSAVWENSASLWDHALSINPNFKAYLNRALAYDQEKNYEKAIEFYTEGIRLNPKERDGQFLRGKAYVAINNPDLAYVDFKNCLAIDSVYFAAMDNLGVIYLGRKQYDSALLNFNRALELKTDYSSSYKNRALTFMELKRYEEAIADFKSFLKYQPKDPDILNAIGACYRLNGNDQNALPFIDKALSLKQDPHFYLNRAYCYGALKNSQQARKDAMIAKQAGLILEPVFAQQMGIQQ